MTDGVRILYDQTTGGKASSRASFVRPGGGWTIPSSRIPFATDCTSEPDAAAADPDAGAQDITDLTEDETPSAEPTLDFAPGFAPEPSRGSTSRRAKQGGRHTGATPTASAPPLRFIIPRSHWPDEECNENYGLGWEVVIIQTRGPWSRWAMKI